MNKRSHFNITSHGSLLLPQNIVTSNSVVLQPPELAQTHKLINEFGDVLILNKSSLNEQGTEVYG
jgi:hypothetical protein